MASISILNIESQIQSDPFNPLHHIDLAKAYLEKGDEEQARKVTAIKRRLPSKNSSVHFEWGKLCEELGMARQARESYEQAIALDPNNGEYHWRIARLLYERGGWERALKHLQKTVVLLPQNVEAKEMLSSLYREMGFTGSASLISRKKEATASTPRGQPLSLSEQDVLTFMNLFSGKEVGFVRYQFGQSGDLGHVFVNGPIRINEIIRHLRGEGSFGVYPVRADGTLKYSLIRIRVPWRRIVGNIKNSGFLAITEDKAHDYARKVVGNVRNLGLPAYLEKPGKYERRIWFFFEDFIPHEMAKRFLDAILEKTIAPGVDLAVDSMIGLKGVGIGQEDFPIMLPLGINPRAGGRCFFLDDEDKPYEDQLLFLRKIRTISRHEIKSFVTSGVDFKEAFRESSDSLKVLTRACSVIDEIVRKANSGRNLQNEEKVVLYFSIKFLKDGERILHHILENCPDYRQAKVNHMLSGLKGNPISCPKVRQLLPETTAYLTCNCSFVIPEGGYPSPLLHIDSQWVPVKEVGNEERRTMDDETKRLKDHRRPVHEIEERYRFVCNQIEQFTKEKEKLEMNMKKCMTNDEEPCSSFKVHRS